MKRVQILLAALTLFILSIFWLLFAPPIGLKVVELNSLYDVQGPWFEIKHSFAVQRSGESPLSVFAKFTGEGGDRLNPYPDPSDPRMKFVVVTRGAEGPRTVLEATSTTLTPPLRGSFYVSCFSFIRCGFHIVGVSRPDENHPSWIPWIILTGPLKSQWWVFGRSPGITDATLEKINQALEELGLNAPSLEINQLPAMPDQAHLPAMPRDLPKLPEIPPAVPEMPKP